MKTISSIIFTTLASSLILVSCDKENLIKNDDATLSKGPRVITVSLSSDMTRTDIGPDNTPFFKEDDEIMVYQVDGGKGAQYQPCPVEITNGIARITTTLEGNLLAVYPSSAFIEEQSPYFQVERTQNGSFEKANICTANIDKTTTDAIFDNKTTLIRLAVPEGTNKLVVTSQSQIVNGQRTGNAVSICNEMGWVDELLKEISVNNPPAICYVSIVPGVLLQDLSFNAIVDENSGFLGGFAPNNINKNSHVTALGKTSATYQTEEGYIYELPSSSLHEYVTVGGKKWATRNVGASSPTEYGDYFMWGETTGQKPSGSTFDPGFSWTTYYSRTEFTSAVFAYSPSSAKQVLKKYVPSGKASTYGDKGTYFDDKDRLDLEDDAAFWNWGGAWRMPTNEDFTTFLNGPSSFGEGGSLTHQGVFFPAAGCGDGTGLGDAGGRGNYWSSSLYTGNPTYAHFLNFYDGAVGTQYNVRYDGRSVRPLSE